MYHAWTDRMQAQLHGPEEMHKIPDGIAEWKSFPLRLMWRDGLSKNGWRELPYYVIFFYGRKLYVFSKTIFGN